MTARQTRALIYALCVIMAAVYWPLASVGVTLAALEMAEGK